MAVTVITQCGYGRCKRRSPRKWCLVPELKDIPGFFGGLISPTNRRVDLDQYAIGVRTRVESNNASITRRTLDETYRSKESEGNPPPLDEAMY
jgi:hypothetical protein